jgi:hypothetical protein
MPTVLADKIKNTQNSFAPQPTGSVAACPYKKIVAESKPPVEVETAFALTQQIMQSMGVSKATEKPKEKKVWIEILLVDKEGKPVPGIKYRITPPGGKPVEGTLNQYGQAGLYQIDPGNCKITFPDLDKDAWD